MRYGIRTETDWSLVGAELAKEDDHAQIKFFKAFLKEAQTYGTHFQTEMQLISINKGLTNDEKELAATIAFKEE